MKKRQFGFTIIELVIVIVIMSVAGIFFFLQKEELISHSSDERRKTAINAMYYGLEEVFYKENGYYPQVISSKVLRSVDPILFDDPNGIRIGESGSDYSYSPSDCNLNKCKKYVLKADLEKEADFVKNNLKR